MARGTGEPTGVGIRPFLHLPLEASLAPRLYNGCMVPALLSLLLMASPVQGVKEDIKQAGKQIGHGFKKGGKAVGQAAKEGGKAVGRGAKTAGKGVAKGAKEAGRGVKKAVK